MANLKQKIFLCVVLFCLVKIIKSIEIDDKTKDKITELVGEKQITLRRYLEGIKQETDKIEFQNRRITAEAKDSLERDVNKTIDDIKEHTVRGPNNTDCIKKMNQGIQEIMTQFETTHTNCVSSTKPDIPDLFRDITKFAEFQSKIGSTPKQCMDSTNDIESLLKCIEQSMNVIGKEIEESHVLLKNEVQQIQKQVKGLDNSMNSCQNKDLGEIKNKADVIKEQLNECVKA